MDKSLRFELLSNCQAVIPTLASWYAHEWGAMFTEDSYENSVTRLQAEAVTPGIPFTVVGFLANEPIATASILLTMPETGKSYSPWLGYVYVAPDYRQRGFGKAIIKAALDAAAREGKHLVYLYTTDAIAPFYETIQWRKQDRTADQQFIIMSNLNR